MSDILNKLSSYNIFNYLLPGTLFAAAGDTYTSFPFIQENLFVAGFAYYFFGLVISRIGSLMVEPALKKFECVEFSDYPNYVTACQSDKTIEQLSEANNIYRTLISLMLFIGATIGIDRLGVVYPQLAAFGGYLLFAALLALFLFSYRK